MLNPFSKTIQTPSPVVSASQKRSNYWLPVTHIVLPVVYMSFGYWLFGSLARQDATLISVIGVIAYLLFLFAFAPITLLALVPILLLVWGFAQVEKNSMKSFKAKMIFTFMYYFVLIPVGVAVFLFFANRILSN